MSLKWAWNEPKAIEEAIALWRHICYLAIDLQSIYGWYMQSQIVYIWLPLKKTEVRTFFRDNLAVSMTS